jgi:GT2 family glycosyltransferase
MNLFVRRFLPILAPILDKHYLLTQADMTQAFSPPSLSGCFMFLRLQALKQIGGFDERYFMYLEDVDLSRRMAAAWANYFVPNATVVHEYQKGSYRQWTLLKAHIVSAILYFNKWGWFFDTERQALNDTCLKTLPRRTHAHQHDHLPDPNDPSPPS